jgi:2-C-methyl-D-erythritol 4-phosphate cytidylyltransferase
MRVIGIILAGGKGERLGHDEPKQFLKFAGLTCLEHTFIAFYEHFEINKIIIVSRSEYIDRTRELIDSYVNQKECVVIAGGENRNISTFNALKYIKKTEKTDVKLVIHDAVRPLITSAIISKCIYGLDKYSAVDTAVPAVDTIICTEERIITSIPDRQKLMYGQTPQAFIFSKIWNAYKKALNEDILLSSFSDDCGLFLKYMPEEKIFVEDGAFFNHKLTKIEDLPVIDRLFMMRNDQTRGDFNVTLLRGKVVIVFGGNSGIGRAITEMLSGISKVYTASRSVNCDIGQYDDINRILKKVYESEGKIDIIINTVGILIREKIINISSKQLSELLDANYVGPLNIAKASYKYLKRTNGMLVFMASSSYTRGRAYYAIYSSLKAAVVNLTQALADEWSSDGVKVNCISPMRTNTLMRTKVFEGEDPRQLLSKEEVAWQTLHLCTKNITGQILDVKLINDGI